MDWQQIDAKLRRHGFKVFSRRKDQRDLWERDGRLYTVTEALTLIRREVAAVATKP